MKSFKAVKASFAVSSSVQGYFLSVSVENPTAAGDYKKSKLEILCHEYSFLFKRSPCL
jgi:hypothetical protein